MALNRSDKSRILRRYFPGMTRNSEMSTEPSVSYSYQWIANDGTSDTDIQNATGSTYTLVNVDESKTLKVKVTFNDDADNEETLTSAATSSVAARPNSAATGVPTISGTAQVAEALTAHTSGIADTDGLSGATFSYQWVANDGTSDTDIQDATGTSYTLVDADGGKTIQVRVSFTDDAGNEETLTSAATGKVQPEHAVQNQDEEDQLLLSVSFSCDPVDWTVLDGRCYHWKPVQFGFQLDRAVNDDDPNTVDYVLRMDMLHEDGTDANECEGTNMGKDIEVTTVEDELVRVSGYWEPTVDCEPGLYTMRFSAREGDSDAWVSGETGDIPFALPLGRATGRPSISGTAQVGETLTADTTGIADADGMSGATFRYQWVANDGTADTDIAGATDSAYTLVADEDGKTIRVRVYFTDDAGNKETLTSAATEAVSFAIQQQIANSPATGVLGISGTSQVGETLTANTSGITDDDGLTSVSYSYQWIRNDGNSDNDITGATNSTYTLVADDEGRTVKAQVSFTDDAGNDETLTSAATDAVKAAPQPNNSATGAPAIIGTAQVDETLTADTSGISDDDGLVNAIYSYQWVANDGGTDADISGETDATYTLVADDVGNTIKVKVTFTDDAGNETTLTSAATEAVAAAAWPDSPATGQPTINGAAKVGEMLTADTTGITDADGLVNATFSYQWLGDDTDIAGATSSTYTLAETDEGKTIKVRVSFTDDRGNSETGTSAATAVVAAPEPPAKPTGLSAAVISHDTVTLAWDNPQDDTITGYVILRRDREIHPVGTFVTITGDTGSADTTYTDDSVEPEKQYNYKIKAINEYGNVSEISDWVRADTPAAPVPDKPTGLSTVVSYNTVALTWDDPQDDSITGYVILRRDRAIHPIGTFVTIAGDTASADTTYTDDTVEPDKEYVYRIKAINEHGKVSEISDWVRGFTPAAPAPAG